MPKWNIFFAIFWRACYILLNKWFIELKFLGGRQMIKRFILFVVMVVGFVSITDFAVAQEPIQRPSYEVRSNLVNQAIATHADLRGLTENQIDVTFTEPVSHSENYIGNDKVDTCVYEGTQYPNGSMKVTFTNKIVTSVEYY